MTANMFLLIIICVIGSSNYILAQNLKNVLMFIVDDLRPELRPFIDTDEALYPNIQTPYIDSLAADSIVFKNAYSQWPVCGPSRGSFMTGRRPDTTKVYNNGDFWRDQGGNFTSMPQYFKNNGYLTFATGKVYHGDSDNDFSWTENNYKPNTKGYWHNGTSWGIARPEEFNNVSLPCMQIRDYAVEKLQEMATQQENFFIAVGFEKPHLPLIAPRQFFNLYPEEDIYLPANPYVPINHPRIAWSSWGDLSGYDDIQEFDNRYNQTLPDYKALELRRAYYASVSYTDSLIGDVLEELDRLGMANDTVVLMFSDHGWQLGEHAEWAKMTHFELDLHVPMILKVPGLTDGGIVSNALVENIDIFPTLTELAGLGPLNQCPRNSSERRLCHEGHSMVELISNPNSEWKTATFSQLLRGGDAMGHTIMTGEYRYVRWMTFVNDTMDWEDVIAEELFDLITDPNQLENVAGYTDYADIQEELSERLNQGWRQELPPEIN